jgi:hypothetical protein
MEILYKPGQIVVIKKRFCKKKGHRDKMYGCGCTEEITIQSSKRSYDTVLYGYYNKYNGYNNLYSVSQENIIGKKENA